MVAGCEFRFQKYVDFVIKHNKSQKRELLLRSVAMASFQAGVPLELFDS
jgi:hypothetical protein